MPASRRSQRLLLFNRATDTFTKLTGSGRSPGKNTSGGSSSNATEGPGPDRWGCRRPAHRRAQRAGERGTLQPGHARSRSSRAAASRSPNHAGRGRGDAPLGAVLIAGGGNNERRLSTAELFDPATDTFTSSRAAAGRSPKHACRDRCDAALRAGPDRRGLERTWRRRGNLSTAELLNPTTDTFTKLTGSNSHSAKHDIRRSLRRCPTGRFSSQGYNWYRSLPERSCPARNSSTRPPTRSRSSSAPASPWSKNGKLRSRRRSRPDRS